MFLIDLRSGTGLAPVLACVWLTASPLRAATVAVNCDTGGTIGRALSAAKPGDTILVSGTCRESVFIQAEATRIVLNGQGKAIIEHPGGATAPGPAAHAVYIRGRMITITGFRITGGAEDGIHLSGPAHAVIDRNVIVHNKGRGVHLDKGSVAQVVNNTITDNGGVGISVSERSYARIGFLIPPDSMPRPNIIRNNGGGGIQVERSSNAWIVANTIVANIGPGIAIDRSSEADVVANTINGNRGDGIVATHNSGVNLQSRGSPRREGPNRTDPALKNRGVGIRCSVGGYVDGPLGSLTGILGAKRFDSTCIDRLTLQ
jgi:nitrous oxidase accessory protein NosD